MSQKRKVITIDGLAGTGKTTISQELAKRVGFIHFSTGLLYRTVGYICLDAGIDLTDEQRVAEELSKRSIELILGEDRRAQVLLDGQDISEKLYEPEVSEATSIVAQYKAVRGALSEPQRNAFPGEDILTEGRDMGSVVFPDADMKFFIEVDEDVKVERRLNQMSSGKSLSPEGLEKLKGDMKREIHERDIRDAERCLAPTKRLDDMILINNSSDPLEKVVQNMYNSLRDRGVVAE